jgi:hypothetical protein
MKKRQNEMRRRKTKEGQRRIRQQRSKETKEEKSKIMTKLIQNEMKNEDEKNEK